MKLTTDQILQMMLDAAEEYGLGWCSGQPFVWRTHCCAIGALALAVNPKLAWAEPYLAIEPFLAEQGLSKEAIYKGNDDAAGFYESAMTMESYQLGAAFRIAMGVELPF